MYCGLNQMSNHFGIIEDTDFWYGRKVKHCQMHEIKCKHSSPIFEFKCNGNSCCILFKKHIQSLFSRSVHRNQGQSSSNEHSKLSVCGL